MMPYNTTGTVGEPVPLLAVQVHLMTPLKDDKFLQYKHRLIETHGLATTTLLEYALSGNPVAADAFAADLVPDALIKITDIEHIPSRALWLVHTNYAMPSAGIKGTSRSYVTSPSIAIVSAAILLWEKMCFVQRKAS